jgi:hypothetical protein
MLSYISSLSENIFVGFNQLLTSTYLFEQNSNAHAA